VSQPMMASFAWVGRREFPLSTPSGLSALREAVVQPVPVSGRSINWCRFDGALAKDETMTN
jgi:hypothetical protein